MLEYILWGITFLSLWLTLIWLNFLYYEKPKSNNWFPKVTIGVPVFNEESTVVNTIKSFLTVDYPKDLLEIIVVDDGSKDNSFKVVNDFLKSNPNVPVKLFKKENGGKSSALNVALDNATGEVFAVVDADSRISDSSIKMVLPHFSDKKIGAVISRVCVDGAKSWLEKIQHFEYIMSTMIRKIMCNFGTLAMTPGVLSMYRTSVLRKVGGFCKDRNNLTEDLEIAMRLKSYGFDICMEFNSMTYTKVPNTIKSLWRQRIRWARGYIYTMLRYSNLFFSRKHGIFGVFQLPFNVLALLLLMINIGIISFDLINRLFEFFVRSFTIPNYFINNFFNIPSLQEFILARNIQVYLPILVALVLSLYLIYFAHRLFKERLSNQVISLLSYLFIMPYFTAVSWVSSIAQELSNSKRRWR